MLIPQSMAYAVIAGLPVIYGLYAALVPQVIYGFLGTSRQLSVGPVAMDSLLVAAGLTGMATIESEQYISLAILLAFMMGAMQFIMGVLRLGFLANFLSRPVISGFTSAVAILIGMNQVPNFLGLTSPRSNQFQIILATLMEQWSAAHVATFALGLVGVMVLVALKNWAPKIPASLVLVVTAILASWLWDFESLGIAVVGTIPQGLPSFSIPSVRMEEAEALLPIALTLSLVAFLEAISVAKSVEEQHAYRTNSNRELRALGLANVVGSFFQSYPTTGGFSRTAVVDESGGKTPAVGWISASIVGLTLLVLTPLFYHLPIAILAAIVMMAITKLVDVRYPFELWKQDRKEAIILMLTMSVTLLVNVPLGIGLGILSSLALTVQKMMMPHVAVLGDVNGVFRNVNRFPEAKTDESVLVLRYDGALNFANHEHFHSTLTRLARESGDALCLVVLQADTLSYVDATARATLRRLVEEWKKHGIKFCLAGAIGPVRDALAGDGLLDCGGLYFQMSVIDAINEHQRPGSVPKSRQKMAQQHN